VPKNLADIIRARPARTEHDVDIDSDDLTAQRRLFENQRYREDTSHRKWLAVWSAVVVTIWLVAVLYILLMNKRNIGLGDTVLVALLGTTTLNVLGLSYIVLRGHFTVAERA
jgi:ABC-type transport system involved in cytochrome c biogenesis permease component